MNWRFWQKNTAQEEQTQLPEAVKEYYDSTRRTRSSTAWLLSLATMVVTLVFASILYFGGRFVYRQFAKNDNPTITVTQNDTNNQPQPGNSTKKTSKPTRKPHSQPVSGNQAHHPPKRTRAVAVGSSMRHTNVPNTGPGNIVAIFVISSVVSMVAYELFTSRVKSAAK